jgi:light-regulated signal transduction histidine kinase (bacteriophytochrome)
VAEGDRRLLRLALENLLGNAFKFTSKEPEARIEFGVTDGEDGAPAYYVRDNGVGFDQAYAGKLFGTFHRLHGQDEFDGVGIGLAAVARRAPPRGAGVGRRTGRARRHLLLHALTQTLKVRPRPPRRADRSRR